ncbi:hypothetical protein [Actinomadura madurae]|uniref:hypothetical protein n=1 Tax=Actinomadura madurae TaxID=1993 RepID=UPI0020D22221|nr:hypothetical protein [Actinomadura madurae]MCP9947350.1 hypothetical protein [Actinomadura madurae]MCP9964116.1 hypothetical protein [Actinomadura madurae]MCP9976588.1 hypothetical protein [Actinomadura madurae]MCQ0011915.1 hypothetical protein [Actinomadura madurae]MCQ0012785.1 hypothetical protein [Actinomadura madurae]
MTKAYTPDPLIVAGADYARRQMGIRNHQFSALRFGDHAHVIDCRADMNILAAIVIPGGAGVQAQVTRVQGEQCPRCAPATDHEDLTTAHADKQAEPRAAGRRRIEAIKASTCETCREGCHCDVDNPERPTGCAHLGCWGPNATGDCPEAIRLEAAHPLR